MKESLRCGRWLVPVLLAAGPAIGQRVGEPPPLLPEPVIAALASELSGTQAREVVQELTLHHRMRASQGIRLAAEVVMRRLEAYGIDDRQLIELPANGKTFYGTQRSRPAWDVELAELWEMRREDEDWVDQRRLASWATRPLSLAQDSVSGELSAELVDVGEGTSKSDYEGKAIVGSFVLAAAQPGVVAKLAVREYGAAGIVSYAQNQKSAWWGEDRNLIRWGHMGTFPEPGAFGFMVTVNDALGWRQRLERGEQIRLRAVVEARRHAGAYTIPMAVIPGSDRQAGGEEIVFSCHLDHPRPGANDNASGCAAILEVARGIAKSIREGKIEPPRRSLRFIWPPEIEGTIALLNARPELVENARAVIHMDMVGGDAERTKAMFHVTRSPASLPTVTNDVAEAFARFVNSQSYAYSATGVAHYPLVDPQGSRQALEARIVDFSMGSDHQVWTEGSFRIPAIYLNDWPDRYIHTDGDTVANIDPTKLLRAAFIGAASGYYLASLDAAQLPALLACVRENSLRRAALALEKARHLEGRDSILALQSHLESERRVVESIERFAPLTPAARAQSSRYLSVVEALIGAEIEELEVKIAGVGDSPTPTATCRRSPEPRGPMWAFDYSYLEDQLEKKGLVTPPLLDYSGRWGSGWEYAYEILNLVDGSRSAAAIRDAVAVTYGSIPLPFVVGYLETLQQIGVLDCD